MSFPRKFKELCSPAMFYFVISIIAMVIVLLQNLNSNNIYRIGSFSTQVPNTALIFVIKLMYIIFWTWILNLICKDGYTGISWLLVLLPWILLFVLLGLVMVTGKQ